MLTSVATSYMVPISSLFSMGLTPQPFHYRGVRSTDDSLFPPAPTLFPSMSCAEQSLAQAVKEQALLRRQADGAPSSSGSNQDGHANEEASGECVSCTA